MPNNDWDFDRPIQPEDTFSSPVDNAVTQSDAAQQAYDDLVRSLNLNGQAPPPEVEPSEPPAWRTDPLPTGLLWAGNRVILDDYATRIKYPRRLAGLRAWATQYGLKLRGYRTQYIDAGGSTFTAFATFDVMGEAEAAQGYNNYATIHWGSAVCLCGYENFQGSFLCGGCGTGLLCYFCRNSTNPTIVDDDRMVCLGCARSCYECQTPISSDWDYCTDHGSRQRCSECGDHGDAEPWGPEGRILCQYCAESRCGRCEDRRHDDYFLDDYGYVCQVCHDDARFGDMGDNMEEDDLTAEVASFEIPTIPGREQIRSCGVEIEGGGRPQIMVDLLRNAGLTRQVEMNGYHFQSRHGNTQNENNRDWSIEHDGSVDWELVSPKLNMAEPADVLALDTAVKTLRGALRDKTVTLDMRCGLHVHIGAARVPVGGAYKLKGYWDYLEDVIFRLGAAKWPFHRAVLNGGEYTRNTPKQGMSNKLDFARHYERNNDRYYALSFANYFSTFLENCHCGAARYDTWDNCTCDLGKCTFEFRVFNTSANPTKIHAYLALCQALVAKAASGEDVTDIYSTLPPMAFDPIVFSKASAQQQAVLQEGWMPRLTWIFNELPLTDDEKRGVMYCVEHSELGTLDTSFLASLNPDQYVMEVGA